MMPRMLKKVIFYALLALAVGWIWRSIEKGGTEKRAAQAATAAENQKLQDERLRSPPTVRTMKSGEHGEMLKISFYEMDGHLVTRRHCYVWRDAATKTTSMTCPGSDLSMPGYDDDRPEDPEYRSR